MWQTRKRIEALETVFSPDPIICECVDPKNGEAHTMPLKECLKEGYIFSKVVSGGSMDDLWAYLQDIQEDAESEGKKYSYKGERSSESETA